MASRKQGGRPQNDAEAVFDRLFGHTEGWKAGVAAATAAAVGERVCVRFMADPIAVATTTPTGSPSPAAHSVDSLPRN